MENLNDVKVGDLLIVSNHYGNRVEAVERLTETLVITKYGRYRKRDGYEQGRGTWGYTHARLGTTEEVDRVNKKNRKDNLAFKCRQIKFETLSILKLEEILKIAEEEKI